MIDTVGNAFSCRLDNRVILSITDDSVSNQVNTTWKIHSWADNGMMNHWNYTRLILLVTSAVLGFLAHTKTCFYF